MKDFVRRGCAVLGVYIGALLACVGFMGLLSTVFPIVNWYMGGVGIWFVFCFGSLCITEEGWNCLLAKKK